MARAVTDPSRPRPSGEMGAIGYAVAAASMLAMIPLLPFFAVLWVYDRLTGSNEPEATPRPAE